jgi:hypothetical protein
MLIEAYGVSVRVDLPQDDEVQALATKLFPPGWRESKAKQRAHIELLAIDDLLQVKLDGRPMCQPIEKALALGVFDSQLRLTVAKLAPERTFIHAGVVASAGRAIVLPGASFAGKTTLVSALIRQGATYLSDECAVLDANGLVHPYARSLSMRSPDAKRGTHPQVTTAVPAASLGAQVADEAVPIALIATVSYRADASWNPEFGSPAEGALALMSHAVNASTEPAETLRLVSAAAQNATVLHGERGDAQEAAAELLKLMAA